jgi:hypothetical protein
MNTGQMLLVLGAVMLLSTIALSVNRVLLDSGRSALDAQAGMMAVAVGQGRLEELAATDFDSLTVGGRADSIVTPYGSFACITRVVYVRPVAPDTLVAFVTSLKRVGVTVDSEYLSEPVVLQTIVGDY